MKPFSIRTKVTLVLLCITAAGFIFLTRWLAGDIRQFHLQSLEETLVDTSNLLAAGVVERMAGNGSDLSAAVAPLDGELNRVRARRFEARIYSFTKREVDVDVYVTDATGLVVFDSERERVGLDYGRWNDVKRTLDGQYGARSSRVDPEDPTSSILHVAAPLELDGIIHGVLTVRKPVGNVSEFIATARRRILAAGWMAGLGVAALAALLSLLVTRPIRGLTKYVRAIRDGAPARLPALGNNEIGEMGAAIEEMREALEGKQYVEEYVHALTHEFKSPLAAVQGAAELLEEDMPPKRRARFLDTIQSESERMRQLVDRLLLLANVETRKDVPRDPVDLVAELHPLVQARHSRPRFELSTPDSLQILGDPLLLRQALDNLLQNAVDFSPEDGVIGIELSAGKQRAHFRVLDEGPGIPDYAMERLAERFYSLPRPRSGKKSTGLGLSLVRAVAELHGGTLTYGNRPSGGAFFELELPLS